jgi:hypothetical protein
MRFRYGVAAVAAGMITGLAPAAGPAAGLALPHRAPDRAAAGPYRGTQGTSLIAVSPDGSTLFVGGTQLTASNAATGRKLWSAIPGTGPSAPIVVSPDSSTVFGTGSITDASGDNEFATYAYNAKTGARLWLATYHDPGSADDGAGSIAVSPDGSTVYVTGTSNTTASQGGSAGTTVAYNAATGAQLWAVNYSGSGTYDEASSVAVSPDGSQVFVTGQNLSDALTIAYQAATGAMSWVADYKFEDSTRGGFVGVSPDGSTVYVAGQARAKTKAPVFAVEAYDAATGAQLWTQQAAWGGALLSMTVSPAGSGVFVLGQSPGKRGTIPYTTIGYDGATGARLWGSQWPRRWPLGLPFAMGVSPDGSEVFDTGYAQTEPGNVDRTATVAYNAATGKRLWSNVYGGANNAGIGVATSPDGAVAFVTGSAGTVAYKAATGAKIWTAPLDECGRPCTGWRPRAGQVPVSPVSSASGRRQRESRWWSRPWVARGDGQAGAGLGQPRSWATRASDCSTVIEVVAEVNGAVRLPPSRKITWSVMQARRSGCRSAIAICWRSISCCLAIMAGTAALNLLPILRAAARPAHRMAAPKTAPAMSSSSPEMPSPGE